MKGEKSTYILEKYRRSGISKGNELVFQHKDALNILAECERMGIMVLGMEFYQTSEGAIVEMVGNGADYSQLLYDNHAAIKSVREARRLIQDDFPDRADWVSFDLRDERIYQA